MRAMLFLVAALVAMQPKQSPNPCPGPMWEFDGIRCWAQSKAAPDPVGDARQRALLAQWEAMEAYWRALEAANRRGEFPQQRGGGRR